MTEVLTTATAANRINNHAKAHRQFVNDVMDSLVISKQYDHLSPIIENAIRLILDAANQVRQQQAADECINKVYSTLRDVYLTPGGRDNEDEWETASNLSEMTTEGVEVDADGNILKEGELISYEEASERYKWEEEDMNLKTNERLRIETAVEAANESTAFKAAGVQLIVTPDLLVYAGMAR